MNEYLNSVIICANFFFCIAFFLYICNREIQERNEEKERRAILERLNDIIINDEM